MSSPVIIHINGESGTLSGSPTHSSASSGHSPGARPHHGIIKGTNGRRGHKVTSRGDAAELTHLQVSMDDYELFPRGAQWRCIASGSAGAEPKHTDLATLEHMEAQLNRLWWSRLLIATRGYVANNACDQGESEDTLFSIDDAFITLHRAFVERPAEASGTAGHLDALLQPDCVRGLAQLAQGYQLSEERHPFYDGRTKAACRQLLGLACGANYPRAYNMLLAYGHFRRVLHTLMQRWPRGNGNGNGNSHTAAGVSPNGVKGCSKSVKFEKDPEWEPTERVVVFQQFFQGNRTWVLLDFDRRVLSYHRPEGVRAIFGDRYTQAKLDEGFQLCAYCGMLEHSRGQFLACPQCQSTGAKEGAATFCSDKCVMKALPKHMGRVHAGETVAQLPGQSAAALKH